MQMATRILVTGGAGYIGSILVPALLKDNYEVTVLDNFLFGQATLLDHCIDPNLKVVRGDCRDKATIEKLLRTADVIIPLAAIVGAPACWPGSNRGDLHQFRRHQANPGPPFQAATDRVAQHEQRLRNRGGGVACTEKSPLRPISLYGKTKVQAEIAALEAGNAITFRLATVFGMSPRMRIDLLVNDFVHRAIMDRAVTVFEGHAKRNYIHVRDVARRLPACHRQLRGHEERTV